MRKNDTIDFLNSLKRFGWRLGLANISQLLLAMGNPHRQFKSIHIAGTNGKGSTAAMLESILRHAGYKTGLFTSPHLIDVTERIKVNAQPISTEQLSLYLDNIQSKVQSPGCTYFETLTAVAFKYFADSRIDVAVVEVGLGGRFDATNVIHPLLSIITDIELDHTEYLGQTKSQIAEEKAGIMKKSAPCISGSTNHAVNAVLKRIADDRGTPFYQLYKQCEIKPINLAEDFSEFEIIAFDRRFSRVKICLAGRHQLRNAGLAVLSTEILRRHNISLEEKDILNGLGNLHWPGRLQKLQDSPIIVIDVAHNPASMRKLLSALRTLFHFKRLIVIIGMLKDKNYKQIAKLLTSKTDLIVTTNPGSDRALTSQILGNEIAKYSKDIKISQDIKQAFEYANSFSKKNDLICITGSHYTVGDFIKFYKKT